MRRYETNVRADLNNASTTTATLLCTLYAQIIGDLRNPRRWDFETIRQVRHSFRVRWGNSIIVIVNEFCVHFHSHMYLFFACLLEMLSSGFTKTAENKGLFVCTRFDMHLCMNILYNELFHFLKLFQ